MTTTINYRTFKATDVCRIHLEATCAACKGAPTRSILRECAASPVNWSPKAPGMKPIVVTVRGERHERFADEGASWGALVRASARHDNARCSLGEGPRESVEGSPATGALASARHERRAQILATSGPEAAAAFSAAYVEAMGFRS